MTPAEKIKAIDTLAEQLQADGDMHSYGVLLTLSAAIEQRTTGALLNKCQEHARAGFQLAMNQTAKLN